MKLYKWLWGSDLRYSVEAHTQKSELQVGKGQRRIIKKEERSEVLIPQEQNKRALGLDKNTELWLLCIRLLDG